MMISFNIAMRKIWRTSTRSSVGCKLNKGGPPKPDVTFMSEIKAKMALKEWRVKRKASNDHVQHKCRKSLQKETSSADLEHSGVLYPQLHTMTEVESSPLLVGHTFPVKELLLLCIAKEANLSGCRESAKRSDNKHLQVIDCNGSSCCVWAVFWLSAGWAVTTAKTREITPSQESQDDENVEVNDNEDDVNGIEEDDADVDIILSS